MTSNDWLTKMLSLRVRKNLGCAPNDKLGCFYGNPLGGMAMQKADQNDLCTNVKVRNSDSIFADTNIWPFLISLSQVPSAPLAPISSYAASHKHSLLMMLYWEWMWAYLPENNNKRLDYFRDYLDGYPLRLWASYELVMQRALAYAKLQEHDIPPEHFPISRFNGDVQRIVSNAESAASTLYDWRWQHRNELKTSFQLVNVPPHVARLLVPKLTVSKEGKAINGAAERGGETERKVRIALEQDERIDTTVMQLEAWPVGGKKQVQHGRIYSPTAGLFVAIAIENWFRVQHDLTEILAKAWESNMNNEISTEKLLPSPDNIARMVQVENLLPNARYRFTTNTLLAHSAELDQPKYMLSKCKLSFYGDHTIIEGVVKFPEWITIGLTNVVAVIHTIANVNVNGNKQTETVYAEVLDVEDVDDDGDSVRLRIVPLFALTPLLNSFQQANRSVVEGLLTKRNLRGTDEPVLGIVIYLTDFKILPLIHGTSSSVRF